MPFGLGKFDAGSKSKAAAFDAANDGDSREKRSAQEPPPEGKGRKRRGGCGRKSPTDDDSETPSPNDDVDNVRRKRSARPPPRGPPPNEDGEIENNGEIKENQRNKCKPHPKGPPPRDDNNDGDYDEASKPEKMNDGKRRGKCGRGPPGGSPPPNGDENDYDVSPTSTETESFRKKRNTNIDHKKEKRSENSRVRRCNRGNKNRKSPPTGGGTPESPEGDAENVRRKRETIEIMKGVSFYEKIVRQKRQQTNDPDGVVTHPDEPRDVLGNFVEGVKRAVKKFINLFQSESAEVEEP